MTEDVLILLTDVQAVREISASFNTVRFNNFALEVQRTNLRQLLGDALYVDFVKANKTVAGKYKTLLEGEEYTDGNGDLVNFYGIKLIIVYWWLAIATREGDLFLSNVGAIQLVTNPQQSFETAKEKERIALNYMSNAEYYSNNLIDYLNFKATDYPLWKSSIANNGIEFVSFKL